MNYKIKNFRDIACYSSVMQSAILYRSSCLLNLTDHKIDDFLKNYGIKTVIDLRSELECLENNYLGYIDDKINIIHAPFDPYNQSPSFQTTWGKSGTNEEIAYRFFMLECKVSIRTVIKSILASKDPVLVHCTYGKDRTGIIIAILQLLCKVPSEIILTDYLSNEDTKLELINIVFEEINQVGGIELYLSKCALSDAELSKIKDRLTT